MSEKPRGPRPHVIAALALAVSVSPALLLAGEPTVPTVPPAEGQAAIVYPVPDLNGRLVDLGTELKGNVSLITFWTSWCSPCVQEMPRLRAIARTHRGKGVVVVGIGLREGGDTAAKQAQTAGRQLVNYLLLFDKDGLFQAAYGLRSVPHNLLVGADGKVRWQGADLPDDLESKIQALLAEAAGGSRG